MKEVVYQPQETVRDILFKLKHYTSIAVDLSLYAISFEDRIAALEALRLEDKIDSYYRDLLAKTSIAVRSPDQAKIALGIYEVAHSLDIVSDAAGDMAGIVMRGYPVHEYVKTVVNCCGEIVALLKSRRRFESLPSIADVLLIKRGESYMLAPSQLIIEEGDSIVVRGTLDAVVEVAEALGDAQAKKNIEAVNPTVTIAFAGDDLASSLLRLKSLSRQMLDLALHSLIYNDESLARTVVDMEDTVDQVYLEVLQHSYSASTPQMAREMVSLSIFAKAMEAIGDAATRISRSVILGYNSSVVEEAMEEQEEAYLKLVVRREASGKNVEDLKLDDMGFVVVALGRGGLWIIPVKPEHAVYEGDVILVKYYRPERLKDEENIVNKLRLMGLEPMEEEE